jgi:general secretion pathway protein J
MPPGSFDNARGLTLVELLMAMAISGLVAALSWAGVSSAIDASEAIEREVSALGDLQRALNLLDEDLLQLRVRPATGGYGTLLPVLRGGRNETALLEFTRGGLANPLQLKRSNLQHVRYRFAEGRLWRQHWQQLDPATLDAEPESTLLLTDVADIAITFLPPPRTGMLVPDLASLDTLAAGWQPDWNSTLLAPDIPSPLPVAVKISLQLANNRHVERVFELPQ